jgi:hypothetical protein
MWMLRRRDQLANVLAIVPPARPHSPALLRAS